MEIEQIEVGSKYKINAAGARSSEYVVQEIKKNRQDQWEIVVKNEYDSHVRIVRPEQIIEPKAPKQRTSTAKKIISNELKVLHDFGDVKLWLEEVVLWPNWGRRGRPAKIAA